MNRYLEQFRQTGRTARMIAEANKKCSEGVDVAIIFCSQSECNNYSNKINPETGYKLLNPNIKLIPMMYLGLTWQDHLADVGIDGCPEVEIFIDHYVIEFRYENILNRFFKYA